MKGPWRSRNRGVVSGEGGQPSDTVLPYYCGGGGGGGGD